MRLPRLNAIKFPRLSFLDALLTPTPPKESGKSGRHPYHAVSVLAGFPCCAAARELEGERFLADRAPLLPLPGCDQRTCECAYQHHADRREGPRRDEELGLPGLSIGPQKNRREKPDRRKGNGRPASTVTDYFEHATGTHRLLQLNAAGKPLGK